MATLETSWPTSYTAGGTAELNVCERTLDRWRRLDEGPPVTNSAAASFIGVKLAAWLRARERR